MNIIEVQHRTPHLLQQLLTVWESSVKVTHLFLSNDEIQNIKEFVPQALSGVAHLLVAQDSAQRPVAFMSVENGSLEMLFISPQERGKGLGKRLVQYGIDHYAIQTVSVNEQNPQAKGFYEHMGFLAYKRTNCDEQGNPYPLLYMTLLDKSSAFAQNTPTLTTERLVLRKFTKQDLPALFSILQDEQVNRFLPWYPAKTMTDAENFYTQRYLSQYSQPLAYAYAICLKEDYLPIGYINLAMEDAHDLGYGLRKEFWHKGIATEAARAVIEQAKKDGLPYITATHDKNNPRSGGVMRNVGMQYRYSYQEQWQPKDFLVIFRMYQLNLDGNEDRVYQTYWDNSSVRFVETDL